MARNKSTESGPRMLVYRKKENTGKTRIRTAGGFLDLKPGDTIELPYGSIPESFLDQFDIIGPDSGRPELTRAEPVLEVKPAEDEEGFNVFNIKSGKQLNGEPLTREDVDELLKGGTAVLKLGE